MGCFNCGDPSHMLKNCPKDGDLMRAAKGRLEYLKRKTGKKRNAHTVLFALCQQLTVTEEEENKKDNEKEDDEETTDQELFSTLMAEFEDNGDEAEVGGEETVFLVNVDLEIYLLDNDYRRFLGAWLDTGVTMSLVGYEQAEAYTRMMEISLVIESNTN